MYLFNNFRGETIRAIIRNLKEKSAASHDEESKKRLDDQMEFMDECETRNKEYRLYIWESGGFIDKMDKLVCKILEEGKLTLNYKLDHIQTNFTSYKRAISHLSEVDEQPPEEYWKRLEDQIIYEAEKPCRR